MEVYIGIEALPEFKNAVLTIGTFDGVHLGHRKIIQAVVDEAEAIGGTSVLVTFEPHPRKVVKPGLNLQLINTLHEKISLLTKTGIHHLVVVPFTEAFSEQSPEQYVSDFLVA
ncbi:MAG TPA: adenylyltransferase/cytidyltransferase family protein, partial [Chitinophagaceae bacterium]|nr:adenylyltransferase/cytidyltransferase family protein [Chitinophagaceae bacterium]